MEISAATISIVREFGLPTGLILLSMAVFFSFIWPQLTKKDNARDKRDGDRESVLLNAVISNADLVKEVSKNMGEGNVLLSTLAHHMTSTAMAIDNIAKRLEVSDAKGEERMETMKSQYKLWNDIYQDITQNAGDGRQIIQRHESAQRQGKKVRA